MSDNAVTWTPLTTPLKNLKPWSKNPRRISQKHAKNLLKSWNELGQFQTIAVGPDFEMYDGHQRLSVLLSAYGEDYLVTVLQSNRPLTDRERKKLVVNAHESTVATWDWGVLSEWDPQEILDLGMDSESITSWLDNASQLKKILEPLAPDPNAEWDDIVPFDQPDGSYYRSIIVHFNDQIGVDEFAKLVDQTITDKTRYIVYPKQIKESIVDNYYVREENS